MCIGACIAPGDVYDLAMLWGVEYEECSDMCGETGPLHVGLWLNKRDMRVFVINGAADKMLVLEVLNKWTNFVIQHVRHIHRPVATPRCRSCPGLATL